MQDSKYWIPISKSMNSSEKSYATHIGKGIDDQLKATSEWLGTSEAEEMFKKKRRSLNNYLDKSRLWEEIQTIQYTYAKNTEEFIKEFYEQGARNGCGAIKRRLAFTDADKEALWYLKKYNFDLIKDLHFQVTGKIRDTLTYGVVSGESVLELTDKLLKIPIEPINNITPRARATMIARTEYARARITGTLQSYQNYGVEMVEVITANDSSVCDICIDISEKNPYNINDVRNLPPFHPNCRCTVSALTGLSEYQNTPLSNPNVVNLVTDSAKINYKDITNYKELAQYGALEYNGVKKGVVNLYDPINKLNFKIDESYKFNIVKSMIKNYKNIPYEAKKNLEFVEIINEEKNHLGLFVPIESRIEICKPSTYSTPSDFFNEAKMSQSFLHEFSHSYDHYAKKHLISLSERYKEIVEKEGCISWYSESRKTEHIKCMEDFAEGSSLYLASDGFISVYKAENSPVPSDSRVLFADKLKEYYPLHYEFYKEIYGGV